MKPVLVLGLVGFATLPLWPEGWRLGLAIGWGVAMLVELIVAHRREVVLHCPESKTGGTSPLLALLAFGFLAKLFLLAAGSIVGAYAGFWPTESYLLAFLAGILLGDGFGLFATARRGVPAGRSSDTPSSQQATR